MWEASRGPEARGASEGQDTHQDDPLRPGGGGGGIAKSTRQRHFRGSR